MRVFHVVNVWWDSSAHQGGYFVLACAKSLKDAAATAKALRTSWTAPIVRDGGTGKRYCYADLMKILEAV